MNDDSTDNNLNNIEINEENIKLETITPVKQEEKQISRMKNDIEVISDDEKEEEEEEEEEQEEPTKELPIIDDTPLPTMMLYFRNVYGMLSLQFTLMFSLFLVSFHSETYKKFLFNSGIFYFFCWGLSLLLIVLFYYRKQLKYKEPYNKILLAILTLTLSYNVSFMGAAKEPYETYAGILTIYIYLLSSTLFAHLAYKKFNPADQLLLFAFIAIFIFSIFATITHGSGIVNMVVSMMLTGLICILISCYIQYILPIEYTEKDLIPSTISVYTSVIGFIVNLSTALYDYISEHWPC